MLKPSRGSLYSTCEFPVTTVWFSVVLPSYVNHRVLLRSCKLTLLFPYPVPVQ
jgi:hypothetical protein